ncbi:MAG: ABC transporter ATP-binding protein [Proteobacteria bacterium]|nr:ABC transporter ATP-binding protein [Pseudomonadota bacterium]
MTRRALLWRWLRVTWAGSGLELGLICLLSLVNAGLVVAFPWLWQYVVDNVRGADTGGPSLRELAAWMAGVGVAQFLLYNVLQGTRSIMNAKIQWRARTRVFEHLSRLDAAFYRRWRAGDLVTRLSDDGGEKISWFLCSGIFRTLEAVLVVMACLIAMASLDPVLTLWVILPLPILTVLQAAAQGALGRRYAAVQRSISGINDELEATFSGIRIVQAAGLAEAARARFVRQAGRQRDAEVRTSVVQQGVHIMYGYGWQMAVVALLLAGGLHVMEGRITLGQFVAFEGFVMVLVWPMFDVGMFLSKYKQTFVALTRLQELMDEPPIARASAGVPPADGRVAASGVGVDAEDGALLLDDVALEAAPGELVALVGEVGAGKSILMQVLAGARPPTRGSVAIGGTADVDLDRAARRAAVAHVPQDPVLLSATVRENILLGREVSDDDLSEALEVSRLAQDLPVLPDRLETVVGARGVTLSGGQQQRVALARALVGRPRVLLLDDATAALDADTEAAFWQRFDRTLGSVAAVVVTHRIATIQRADRVLVLEGGRVVQAGHHAELEAQDGPYRAIYGRYCAAEAAAV